MPRHYQQRPRSRVPYIGELPVVLYPGRLIIIEGSVLPDAIRMSVNLACDVGATSDLAFHLNPRFGQNVVVRNYRVGGHWGEEETASPRKFPFQRNKPFHIQLFATSQEFLVAVEGQHFCAFTYRLPLIRVQIVQVNGDVRIDSLEYKNVGEYPEPSDGSPRHSYSIPRLQSLMHVTRNSVETPFTGELPGGFGSGSQMEIIGKVKILPHSFYVNLQQGSQMWPHPIVPLHINPRFRPGKGGVIRNAWLKGKWGAEEKTSILQFRPGRPFVLRIAVEEDQFVVTVDGALMGVFKHRSVPEIIDTVFIQGDVWIKDIIVR